MASGIFPRVSRRFDDHIHCSPRLRLRESAHESRHRPASAAQSRRPCRVAPRRTLRTLLLPLLTTVALLAGAVAPAQAQVPAPEVAARSWLLMDMTTHTVLYSQLPDERVEPASLTKLMTAYVVFDYLKQKRLTMTQRPPVSTLAYKAIGSRMFVDPKSPATIEELLNGLIVQSGNDAAIVLAEAVGGSEAQFAEIMNAEAKRMGMSNTRFTNASGLPNPEHYSTARDLCDPGDAGDRGPSRLLPDVFSEGVHLQQHQAAQSQPAAVHRPVGRRLQDRPHRCRRATAWSRPPSANSPAAASRAVSCRC